MSCDPAAGHCITCSDEGVPMRVLRAGLDLARCRDDAGAEHDVALELVGPVEVGDVVLVHAGVAIAALEGVSA